VGGGSEVVRHIGGENGSSAMRRDGEVSGGERLCRKEIGGLSVLGERHRRLGRRACDIEILLTLGAGGVQVEARSISL
jgi:hypothetical protein